MLRTPSPLLTGLVATSLVVSTALAWSGWRLLEQQRDLDRRLAQEQVEAEANAFAAGIRERLADLGERLSARLTPSTTVARVSGPASLQGVAVVVVRPGAIDRDPETRLPFLPVVPAPPPAAAPLFEGEAAEFAPNGLPLATAVYERLSRDTETSVRAGALLRLGRALRKSGRANASLTAYQKLAAMGHVPTDATGVPASLLGLDGQRLAYRQLHDAVNEQRLAEEIGRRIDDGAWSLSRGTAEFYRDEVSSAQRPEAWSLATAIADAWSANEGSATPSGATIAGSPEGPVLVLWRGNGANVAIGATRVEPLLHAVSKTEALWQLTDVEDRPIVGIHETAPSSALTRVITAGGAAWTLRLWTAGPAMSASRRGPWLATALAAMLAFVWAATYVMARAIRREAEVARLQSYFVAAVSHEFRTPLSTMRQMTEMLDTDRVPNESRRRQYYSLLVSETARLQRLVETLLHFGRLEAGGHPYRLGVVDVSSVVHAVVQQFQAEPGPAGHRIVSTGPSAVLEVEGDAEAIGLAVRNLVENAVKYSPVETTVRIEWKADGDRVAIAVSDQGPGIAVDEQQMIFRKFVRGHATRDGRIPGTGVGLAIVQRVASTHGGTIQLTSEPGRGSTFTLVLPSARPGASTAAASIVPAGSVN